jgi:hypothetical protein
LQDAAQKAEEQDLKNDGYTPRFTGGMRAVKVKLLHVRATGLCVALIFFAAMGSIIDENSNLEYDTYVYACLALAVISAVAAFIFHNYPRHTRLETGYRSPLSGSELYEEQLRYLKQGISTAWICTGGAIATVVTAFLVFKEEIDANRYAVPMDPLLNPWPHTSTMVQQVALTCMLIGIGLLVTSGMRWFNVVSCQVRLRKHIEEA